MQQSPLKDQFEGQLTTGKTKLGGDIITKQFGSSSKPEVLILFVGGAADKNPYHGFGPNYNITTTKYNIESALYKDASLDISRYYCAYYGFDEVYKSDLYEKVIKEYIFNKNTYEQNSPKDPPLPLKNPKTKEQKARNQTDLDNLKIIVIGHSLGGWNGTHLTNYLINWGIPVNYLITIDPVGMGEGVHIISELVKAVPDSPKVTNAWINIRQTGKSAANAVAVQGERWIPGFYTSDLKGKTYHRSNATLPAYSYISRTSHAYTWKPMNERSTLIKVKPELSYPKDSDSNLITLRDGEKTPWDILKSSLTQWLKK